MGQSVNGARPKLCRLPAQQMQSLFLFCNGFSQQFLHFLLTLSLFLLLVTKKQMQGRRTVAGSHFPSVAKRLG